MLGAAEGVAYLAVAALAVWSVASKLLSGHGLPNGEGTLLVLSPSQPPLPPGPGVPSHESVFSRINSACDSRQVVKIQNG